MKKRKKLDIVSSLIKPYYLKGLFILLSTFSYGADAGSNAVKAQNAPYNQAVKTMEAQAEQKELLKTQAAAATAQKTSENSVIIVDPLTRANDFKEAFSYLAQHKAGSPIFFELQKNEKLYNVLDFSVMKGGSLVIFKMNTTQGQKYKVVKTEDIISIGTD